MDWNKKPEQIGPGGSGGAWLSLKEGTYHLRLVSGYEYIGYHFDNKTKTSEVCPNREKGDDECDLCRFLKDSSGKLYSRDEANALQKDNPKLKFYYNRPSQKFLANVLDLDEETPTVKHVEFPYKVVDMITGYAMHPDYKFDELPEWDMTIVRKDGEVKTQVDWQVQPARSNRALTQEEIEAIDQVPTPKEVVDKKHRYAQEDALEKESENESLDKTEEKKDEIDIEEIPF